MTGNVDYSSVWLGGWDNCWLLSALIGYARRQPDAVLPLIEDLGSDQYQVTLPGSSMSPVLVGPDSDTGQTQSDGPWAGLIESAANAVTDGKSPRVLSFGEGITLLTGKSRTGYSNLTGVGFAPLATWARSQWLPNRLAAATQSGRLMIVGGSPGFPDMKIRRHHCYALLAYEPETQTCRLRDTYFDADNLPQNRQRPGYKPGEFYLELPELERFFVALTIEDE